MPWHRPQAAWTSWSACPTPLGYPMLTIPSTIKPTTTPATTHTLFSVGQSLHPGTGTGLKDDSSTTSAWFSAMDCHSSAAAGTRAEASRTPGDPSSSLDDTPTREEAFDDVWARTCPLGSESNTSVNTTHTAVLIAGLQSAWSARP